MKKLWLFSVSMVAAFVFFVSVAFLILVVLLSAKQDGKILAESENNKTGDKFVTFTAFFADDKRLFAAAIKVDFSTKTVKAREIDLKQTVGSKTLGEIYETEGDYPFATALSRALGGGYEKFIKLTAENFQKITDRTQGLVYNEEDVSLLLTGSQAAAVLNSQRFAIFCKSLLQTFLEGNIKEEFFFATENCKNNFSYPNLCDCING